MKSEKTYIVVNSVEQHTADTYSLIFLPIVVLVVAEVVVSLVDAVVVVTAGAVKS